MVLEWLELIWLAGLTGAFAWMWRRLPKSSVTIGSVWQEGPAGPGDVTVTTVSFDPPPACEFPQVHECHTSVTHPRLRRIRGRR